MAPPSKRRKLTPEPTEASETVAVVQTITAHSEPAVEVIEQVPTPTPTVSASAHTDALDTTKQDGSIPTSQESSSAATGIDRMARFKALKSRARGSAKANESEARAEANRAAVDPALLANLSRRSAIASHNLLKADTEEEGGKGAFERKRAWDYTIEESERWDERMEKKKGARDNNSFQDYSAEAGKIYDRQIRELEKAAAKDGGKHREDYERQKQELIETAARSGGLEIVEMDNGEMIAIDKEGRLYADKDNTGFVEQRPKKENVDRLVEDLRKAEEIRLKKRKERGRDVDEGDVTYINDKNKQFNMKLARFYDRYTTDIRESFERGTAI